MLRLRQFYRMNKMDGSIKFRTTQSVGNYPECSFIFQMELYEWNFKKNGTNGMEQKKMEIYEFKKKLNE